MEKQGAKQRRGLLEIVHQSHGGTVIEIGRRSVPINDDTGLAGSETLSGQPQLSIASCYYELAMAVVKTGVTSYLHWRKCGYVRADGSVNWVRYWRSWKAKRAGWNFRTMAPNKARLKLRAIKVDNDFYHNGIKIYLKILGHENEIEWLKNEIATRVRDSDESDNYGCFG